MKIRDRLRKAFKSLTLKVFLTVACVIIPLNIIMFLVSSYMILLQKNNIWFTSQKWTRYTMERS